MVRWDVWQKCLNRVQKGDVTKIVLSEYLNFDLKFSKNYQIVDGASRIYICCFFTNENPVV